MALTANIVRKQCYEKKSLIEMAHSHPFFDNAESNGYDLLLVFISPAKGGRNEHQNSSSLKFISKGQKSMALAEVLKGTDVLSDLNTMIR